MNGCHFFQLLFSDNEIFHPRRELKKKISSIIGYKPSVVLLGIYPWVKEFFFENEIDICRFDKLMYLELYL